MKKSKNWGQPCPNRECSHHNLKNRGNIHAVSTYMTASGKRRVFECAICKERFSETRGTVFFDLRTPEDKVMIVLKMLLVKVELSGICFVMNVTEETILKWLKRAYDKASEINEHLLRSLPVTQIQLDEMWTFIRRKYSQSADGNGESAPSSEDGRQWVWISFDPVCRLIVACYVGPRSLESALALIGMTSQIVLGVPCFFSDGFSCYLPALIHYYNQIKTFAPTGKRGRPRKPILEPHPDLVYAQLIKNKEKGNLTLKQKVLCGINRLKELGFTIGTSLIERLNLTLRHALAPLTRKSLGFCKEREQLRRRLVFFQTFYNVGRPHQSLRQMIPENERTSSGIIQRKWIERTPGMAAGITDHVYTFRELLTAKFEPIHNQSISG